MKHFVSLTRFMYKDSVTTKVAHFKRRQTCHYNC